MFYSKQWDCDKTLRGALNSREAWKQRALKAECELSEEREAFNDNMKWLTGHLEQKIQEADNRAKEEREAGCYEAANFHEGCQLAYKTILKIVGGKSAG